MYCAVHRGVWRVLLAVCLTAAAAFPAAAQTATVLANFEIGPKHPAGALVQVQDGVFYGVTSEGGAFSKGSVFILYRATDGSWGTYTLHSFNGVNGEYPASLLLGHDRNFYGITRGGGSPDGSGGGTVFRITPFGVFTTLRAFPGNSSTHGPAAPLTQSADGFIWGTTCSSSPDGTSTVFRMTPGGAFATIALSTTCITSLAHADDGQLFGVASHVVLGSRSSSIIRITRTGQLSTLNHLDGFPAVPIFRGDGGVFYVFLDRGSSQIGTPLNRGRAIGFTSDGAFVLNREIFTGRPETLVETSPGVLYGTTRHEFFGPDVLFRLQLDGQFSIVKQWEWEFPSGGISATIGAPRVSLVKGTDGLLYGLSASLGAASRGVAFSLDLSGNPAVLSTFSQGPLVPVGPLVESGGSLYGTSCAGGTRDQGTVFRLTEGVVTTLYSFDGVNGSCPVSLLKGPDGDFYGNTFTGSIFRMTHAGDFSVLHQLEPSSKQFPDAITADANGNLWGNWHDRGGTFVYRVTPAGSFTRFDVPADAGSSGPGFVFGATGDLFGPLQGGPLGSSSSQLFRMTSAGDFTPQYKFPSLEFVFGRLLPATDGFLYGTAAAYHRNTGGHVFRASTDGQVSVVHTFTEAEGYNTIAELAELANGDLAGVMFGTQGWRGGTDYNFGTVFAVSKAGVFRTLHRFTWLDGANPYAGLLVGGDGALYGTTISGGTGGGGVVFRIQP